MRKELGAVLKLIQYEAAVDSYGYGCDIIPPEARCRECYFGVGNWYPKVAPTVRLNLLDEVLVVPLLGVPVIHEALYEVLKRHWPDVLATRCSTSPNAELKVGEKYWSLSLPPKNVVQALYPAGELWQCKVCKRWICSQGPGSRDPYIVLNEENESAAVMSDYSWSLYVNPSLRDSIAQLGIGTIGWLTVPVFSERLPQHIAPDGSLGKDAQS